MSRYAHTQQGACSLRIFSDNILLRGMSIERAGWKLEDGLEEYGDSIGVYRDHILALLEAHRACLTSFSETAHEIASLSEEICHSIQQNDLGRTVIINDYGDGLKLDPWFPTMIDKVEALLDELEVGENSEKFTQPNPSLYGDIPVMPHRSLDIYFVIESSSRMSPITLQLLRDTIEELIPELKDISEGSDADIRIQTITYNVSARCLDKEPVLVTEYIPHMIEPFGLNNFGEACVRLNSLISLPAFLNRKVWPGFQPIVFYLIRSNPTDDISYGVRKLQQNQVYQKHCQKYVCFVGDEQDREMYITSLGIGTNVMRSFAPEEIKKCLRFDDLKEDWFDGTTEFTEIRHTWD